MKILKFIYVLYKLRLFSPVGLYRLIVAIHKYGMNTMALLKLAERFGNKEALVDDHETISFQELFNQSERLSIILLEKYELGSGQKVGFLCRNHASMIKSIFAVSRVGADIYFLNTEMSKSQLQLLIEEHNFDLLIYDEEFHSLIEMADDTKEKLLSYHGIFPAINNLLATSVSSQKLKRDSTSKIMLLTSGTTGKSKEVPHKPSIFNYLNPFLSMLTRLKLLNYQSAYIATPLYHGYGVAVLFLFIALGKKVVISQGFEAKKACRLIRNHQIEVVTAVPLMVDKMLKYNPDDLKSLSCIASGGAELNPKLTNDVLGKLGDVLYNLYGTSETGLNIIATPKDLKYSSKTVGKKIHGVPLKILDSNKKEVEAGTVGQFCVKKPWSMRNKESSWIETGDLGYQDHKGYYFLCGRSDDMIVSAGENVFPLELEHILINHPSVEDVAVIGINDEQFGQRLRAFVQPYATAKVSEDELFDWLRPRAARFQVPKNIIIVDKIPYTPLGKLDRKQLAAEGSWNKIHNIK